MEAPLTAPPSLEAAVAARVAKDGLMPIYLQIREAVRYVVRDLPLPAGTAFPPERVMCEQLGVSKMTLRQAYGLLEREGLIQSRRGVGTFVALSPVEKSLPEMRSFTEEMIARGRVASSRLLSFRLAQPGPATCEFLGLSEGEPVYDIRRLRLADGAPLALERAELPARLFPNLERYDLVSQSLYKVLEENYKIQLGWCNQEVSAALPSKLQRRLLEINTPVALLVIRRMSYTTGDVPVELAVTTYRGDIYTAAVHAKRVR